MESTNTINIRIIGSVIDHNKFASSLTDLLQQSISDMSSPCSHQCSNKRLYAIGPSDEAGIHLTVYQDGTSACITLNKAFAQQLRDLINDHVQ